MADGCCDAIMGAITETLLVAVPIWNFFFLCMQMLQFWERDHLDASVEMNNEFARQIRQVFHYRTDCRPPPLQRPERSVPSPDPRIASPHLLSSYYRA
ncbi:MAG: hypothetical protein ACYTGH_15360 [Planctomycetota bacterium]